MTNSKVVRDGYDQIAKTYLKEREKLKTDKYVRLLTKRLPVGGVVLDVGCGAGMPVDDYLIKQGFGVIGIDISPKQIELARKLVKGGDYRIFNMQELVENMYLVDAVVCLYTMFHVPREEHARLIKILASYLKPGGILLLTMGDCDFVGEHTMFGTKMWSSQWGTEKTAEIVSSCGFSIIINELNTSGGERHQVILATI